jgi:hypothetical protein
MNLTPSTMPIACVVDGDQILVCVGHGDGRHRPESVRRRVQSGGGR